MEANNIFRKLSECLETGRAVAVVTVIGVDGSTPREMGAKMLVFQDGTIEGTVGGGVLEAMAIRSALDALKKGEPRRETFNLKPEGTGMVCGGKVEVLIEVFAEKIWLVVLGCGHVGRSVAALSAVVGVPCVVVDDREEFASRSRFPHAGKVIVGKPDKVLRDLGANKNAYIVIVTRSHMYDMECLAEALKTEAAYIGVIGSVKKTKEVFKALKKKGFQPEKDPRVHAPIGLDLGGKSPGAIALSIMSEIFKVHYGKTGRHMKLTVPSECGRIL